MVKVDLRDSVSTDISPFHIALGVLVHFYAVYVYQHDIGHPIRATNDLGAIQVQMLYSLSAQRKTVKETDQQGL